MPKVQRLVLGTALAALLGAGAAASQEAYRVLPENAEPMVRDIFGPPENTLDQAPNGVNGYFSDDTCGLCGGQQSMADNFIVSTGGLGFEIQQLVFWGGYFPTDTENATDALTVRFLDDSGGLPGPTVLCSENATTPARSQTGIIIFGTNEWIYTLDLAVPCVLADGTYWVEIFNSTAGNPSGDDWYWETGNLDGGNGILGGAFALVVPGSGWSPNPDDQSLQLNGVTVPVELQTFGVE